MSALESVPAEAGSATDTGQIRVTNQDAWGDFQDADGARLFVVADGMGGHKGGETASRLAVETIGEIFRRSGGGPAETLQAAFSGANERVFALAQQDADLHGMGTTAVALLIDESLQAWLAHVGDSRVYRLRRGSLERLTTDHSLVGSLVAKGLLAAEEAEQHPDRHVILRSVGVRPTVEAEIHSVSAEPGDRFLLCSDGLSGVVAESDIAAVLARFRPREAARRLVELANQCGGPDNVTAQVVEVAPHSASRPASSSSTTRAAVDQRPRRRTERRLLLASIVVCALLAAAVAALLLAG